MTSLSDRLVQVARRQAEIAAIIPDPKRRCGPAPAAEVSAASATPAEAEAHRVIDDALLQPNLNGGNERGLPLSLLAAVFGLKIADANDEPPPMYDELAEEAAEDAAAAVNKALFDTVKRSQLANRVAAALPDNPAAAAAAVSAASAAPPALGVSALSGDEALWASFTAQVNNSRLRKDDEGNPIPGTNHGLTARKARFLVNMAAL